MVLDDDPTGTQTVHSVPVLTTWEVPELAEALAETHPCFYVLTNSRALTVERARQLNQGIGANLAAAASRCGIPFTVISRSDSTLRGHFPDETEALAAGLGFDFDGTLLIPAFFAGGRLTIADVHYLANGDTLVPVGESEFARDNYFGYRSSNLRDWVEEKTRGRIRAGDVLSVSLQELRQGGPERVAGKLSALKRGGICIVNAAAWGDLAVLTQALAAPSLQEKRFLFRSAADFVACYAGIDPRPPLAPTELIDSDAISGGLLVAGSYVSATSSQLAELLRAFRALAHVEVSVPSLLEESTREAEIQRCARATNAAIREGRTAVLSTSRSLVLPGDPAAARAFGEVVSSTLVRIVRAIEHRPRWLIAKGGITSSDIATRAIGVRRAMVLGQALPGVPVWRTGLESKWPGMAYIIFPGNVGAADSLLSLVTSLDSGELNGPVPDLPRPSRARPADR